MITFKIIGIASAAIGIFASSTPNERRQATPGTAAILNYPCVGHYLGPMPEVCNNMCYGLNCMKFPAAMYWDQAAAGDAPDEKKKGAERSRKAGCGGRNRCSKPPYPKRQYQCDEFPFKSVLEDAGVDPGPVNRCVETSQNGHQGTMLSNLFYSKGPDYRNGGGLHGNVGWFKISFQNFNGIQYCEPANIRDCTNDGNEYVKAGLATPVSTTTLLVPTSTRGPQSKRTPAIEDPHEYYWTKQGRHLFIPGGADIGDIVHTPAQGEGDSIVFDQDEIISHANSTGEVD